MPKRKNITVTLSGGQVSVLVMLLRERIRKADREFLKDDMRGDDRIIRSRSKLCVGARPRYIY